MSFSIVYHLNKENVCEILNSTFPSFFSKIFIMGKWKEKNNKKGLPLKVESMQYK